MDRSEDSSAVLYARVSTKEQADSGLSIPAQVKTIHDWAAGRGIKIIEQFIEPGDSARDDHRREFGRMVAGLLDGKVSAKVILVAHTSRFMRNSELAFVYRRKLEKKGIKVISVTQATDDSPSGKLMEAIFAAFDQYESDMIGYRTLAAMQENARNNHFNGSMAPFGFMAEQVQDGRGNVRRRVVPCAEEVEALQECFRLYIEGRGGKATAKELTARGFRHRGRPWTKGDVLRVIDERAAIGTYHWGKWDTKAGKRRDESEWFTLTVDPILDPAIFEAAQAARQERDPERNPTLLLASPLLLSGVARCGSCGSSYSLETSGKRNHAGQYDHRYYNCRKFLREGKAQCPGHRVKEHVLDRAVLDALVEKLFTPERCRSLLGDLLVESAGTRTETEARRLAVRAQIDKVERNITKWETAFEEGTDKDIVFPKLRVLKGTLDGLKRDLAALVAPAAPPSTLLDETTILAASVALKDIFVSNDTPMTKGYLRLLVDRVEVSPGKVRILPKPSGLGAVVTATANGRPPTVVDQPHSVLAEGAEWLQLLDSNQGPGG